MAVLVYANGTATTTSTGTGATEYTLANVKEPGSFKLFLDTSDMTSSTSTTFGDVITVTAYQIALASGTKRVAWQQSFYGTQPSFDVMKITPPIDNDLTDTNAVQFTLQQPLGQAASFPFKVLNVGAGDAIYQSQASTWSSNTVQLSTATASVVSNYYRGNMISVIAGTGAGQSRLITAYSTAQTATVTPAWTTIPASTSSVVAIYPAGLTALTDQDNSGTYDNTSDSLEALRNAAGTVSNILGNVIESQGSYTVQQALSIILAAVAGMSTGLGATLLTPNGAATRIAATMSTDNRRTAMALTASTAAF